VIFPPLSLRIIVTLRKLPKSQDSSESTATYWKSSPYFNLLQAIIQKGESLLISGATGSGKTTLLAELTQQIPSHERVIALEDTSEIQSSHPLFIKLLSRSANADGIGSVDLNTLLKQTLRMRPDRLILGECRGAEVLELLQLLNTGHQGALATLHANSCRDALRRLELLCLIHHHSGTLHSSLIRELLVNGLKWIVQLQKTAKGRIISELSEIVGKEGEMILLRKVEPSVPSLSRII
jgi:pilus assembly protein CpaF